jgi:hypothetical protein
MTNGRTTVQNQAAVARIAPKPHFKLFQRFWPVAIIACGLGLTTAWILFLAYGLAGLVGLAI